MNCNAIVEIFKTNVKNRIDAHFAKSWLMIAYPEMDVYFDLSDSQNILRVENKPGGINKDKIVRYFEKLSYRTSLLLQVNLTAE